MLNNIFYISLVYFSLSSGLLIINFQYFYNTNQCILKFFFSFQI